MTILTNNIDSTVYTYDKNSMPISKIKFTSNKKTKETTYKYSLDTTTTILKNYDKSGELSKTKTIIDINKNPITIISNSNNSIYKFNYLKNEFGLDSIETILINDSIYLIRSNKYVYDKTFLKYTKARNQIPIQKMHIQQKIDQAKILLLGISKGSNDTLYNKKYHLFANSDTLNLHYNKGEKKYKIKIYQEGDSEIQVIESNNYGMKKIFSNNFIEYDEYYFRKDSIGTKTITAKLSTFENLRNYKVSMDNTQESENNYITETEFEIELDSIGNWIKRIPKNRKLLKMKSIRMIEYW